MGGNNSQSSYDPAALGGTLGNKLSGYVNNPVPNPNANVGSGLDYLNGIAANAQPYAAGVKGAIGEFGDIASGKRFGTNDPGYATLRANVANDATTAANSVFNSTGRFGANSHAKAIGEGVGNAVAGLDYANQQGDRARQFQAAGALPGMYAASTLPGQTFLDVGQTADQYGANADYNRFRDLLGAFSGSQNNAGMQQEAPWWQTALGIGATGAGILGSFL